MNRKACPSDLSDQAWEFVAHCLTLMDEQATQRHPSLREVFNALRWLARFRRLSRDFERMSEVLANLHFLVFAILMPSKALMFAAPGASA